MDHLLLTLFLCFVIFSQASNAAAMAQQRPVNLPARFAHLRHGINLSHWFSQAANYSKSHLDTHTTAPDIALIKSLGFDHVRFPIEPAPRTGRPGVMSTSRATSSARFGK